MSGTGLDPDEAKVQYGNGQNNTDSPLGAIKTDVLIPNFAKAKLVISALKCQDFPLLIGIVKNPEHAQEPPLFQS